MLGSTGIYTEPQTSNIYINGKKITSSIKIQTNKTVLNLQSNALPVGTIHIDCDEQDPNTEFPMGAWGHYSFLYTSQNISANKQLQI